MADQRGFGRDGITGLVTADNARRARDVSRPTDADVAAAQAALAALEGPQSKIGPTVRVRFSSKNPG